MLRIITPKGVLREVLEVIPVCETRLKYNGKERRLVEVADNLYFSNSTGLALRFQNCLLSQGTHLPTQELFVGNLRPEQVADIQRELLAKGYFDFSALTYQNVKRLKDTCYDQGNSRPYTSDSVVDFPDRFFSLICRNCDIFSQMSGSNDIFSSGNNMQDECVLGWEDDNDDSEA